jgi:DNA-binding transcriptional LysR family regulator
MNLPRINLQHIVAFYFVAHEKSFSAASRRLCITEPGVHQQIKALELQFGVRLVYVKKKRACLTRVGEKLLSYAEEFFNQAVLTENFLKNYQLSTLHLGIAASLMTYLTPIINRFKELQPAVQVTIREGPSVVLGEELADFKHDICLIGTLNLFEDKLRVFRIPQVEQMVFVASPQHPLAHGEPVKWEDLARHPFIIQPEGSMAREIVERHFRERGLKPIIAAEVYNLGCIQALVRERKGIALMFMPNALEDVTAGRLKVIPLIDGEIRLGIDILMNRETTLSPVVEAFLKVIGDYFHFDPYQVPVAS